MQRTARWGPTTVKPGRAVPVVGEARHQRALLGLAGGHKPPKGVDVALVAELVPTRSDPDDPAALDVRIHTELVGRVVGKEARRLREAVHTAIAHHGVATCRARIRGGWIRGPGDTGRFGVTLYADPT